ncbi:MAG: type II secretion system protein GspJ [Alphaproteobacteria bacterium PA4]|nr:MAG: type II secretion system protein GspJ [Alphaproteobacteria bacterium PA4]
MTRDSQGFTLVELLVALFIFALISAAGTALLAFGVEARARTSERLDEIAAMTRLRALLTADLAQAAPRLWRDENGNRQPAFSSDGTGLTLVRRGWRNDGGAARASLQRVRWQVSGGRLERVTAAMVDGAAPNPPAPVLVGVTQFRLRTLVAGQWADGWQPLVADALPEAVEVVVTTDRQPELTQLFLVGPGRTP